MSLDIEDLKTRFLNVDFDEQTFSITAAKLADYAKTCGELAPRYTDPTHPDFQAPPTFPSSFNAGRDLPDGFPKSARPGHGRRQSGDAEAADPARYQADRQSHIHDIYAKSGRSGRMVFIVLRMELYDEPAHTWRRPIPAW